MRVLVVSAWYPPHHLGGYEIACESAVRMLRGRGHRLMVLASRYRVPGPAADGEDRDDVRRDLTLFWEDGAWRRPRTLGDAVRATRRDVAVFARAADDLRPDVVWVWHMAGLSKALLSEARHRRLPVVLSFLDVWPIYDLAPDPWLRWIRGLRAPVGLAAGSALGLPTRAPRLPRDAADAAYCSEWLRDVLAGNGHAPRGRVIYPGIDPGAFPASPLERRVRAFLQVGRVEPRKGQSVAVEALAKLRAAGYDDATLSLAGAAEAGHDADVRAAAARLGVSDAVRLLGPVHREDLALLYAEHDAAIHAATWEEPFGLVLLEAMSCGRPLLCSPTGGASEIVTPGRDALTFAPGDAAGLAAAMEAVAGDPTLARRLADEGRRTAARFTEERAAEEHEAMLLAAVRRS